MILEYIKLSMRELLNNKLRTFLSLIGIVIGVAVVYVILSINEIANVAITNQIAGNGGAVNINFVKDKKNNEDIFLSSLNSSSLFGDNISKNYYFSKQDPEKLLEVEGVKDAIAHYSNTGIIIFNKKKLSIPVKRDSGNYLEFYDLELTSGNKLTDYPQNQRINAALISEKYVNNFLELKTKDILGKDMQLNNRLFKIVGTYKTSGSKYDNSLIISDNAYDLMFSSNSIQYISIKAKANYDLKKVASDAVYKMNEIHNTLNTKAGYAEEDLSFIIDQIKALTGILSIVMSVIGSISLLVAGIGVMNIMLVSVIERTREIGVKRAIGASKSAIQFQFIVESSLLTLFGGIIGISIGVGIIRIALVLLKMDMPINFIYILIAILFSITLGVIFGYLPARRAANLNIIEAIQSE